VFVIRVRSDSLAASKEVTMKSNKNVPRYVLLASVLLLTLGIGGCRVGFITFNNTNLECPFEVQWTGPVNGNTVIDPGGSYTASLPLGSYDITAVAQRPDSDSCPCVAVVVNLGTVELTSPFQRAEVDISCP
jgi:hypothetical protein